MRLQAVQPSPQLTPCSSGGTFLRPLVLTSLPRPTQTKVTNQHPEAKAKEIFVSLLRVNRAQVRM